ncbi:MULTISPECIES: hypothetical protein [Mycobacterium]|uniref:Uncharacterized protein n=1 Tax=Mycobacterium colombiense TaxID=339268 RepID=A0A329L9N4_9MYCO|nr:MULTISPECIES: hypothetical protein [Mycobacterium]MDM4142511.1 hypothetical protein [Mycobacterium sp. FLAC0960]RAV03293.1 hypothetical protein DQP57_25340 [Mycobacterium colombiense]
MSDESYDGYRMVDVNSGQVFRVRGARVVNSNGGSPAYRIRAGGRVVDANSGELLFRIRGGGRVVDVNSGELRYRLRG